MRQRSTFLFSALCFGFAFFYIPIISMIVFSFNKSQACDGLGRLLG